MKNLSCFALCLLLPIISLAQNHAPIAVNDTVHSIWGYPVDVNVLKNDYDPDGDSIFIFYPSGLDSIIQISSNYDFDFGKSKKIFPYIIQDEYGHISQDSSHGLVVVLFDGHWNDSLNINNVNALINAWGHQFHTFDNYYKGTKFNIPNGSKKVSLFNQVLWAGGLDENDNFHTAAERYRQTGYDFWPGPVSNTYDSVYDIRWNNVWKLNRQDIEYHRQHFSDPGYNAIHPIMTWPGNGDTGNGQASLLAPFEDMDGDEVYEPMDGDYPKILGDQCIFFIYNDTRNPHTESNGRSLGIEIHGMAYAFDCPEDSALHHAVFFHYDIYNRSDTSYHDVHLGIFNSYDLGDPWDNRIACDVERGAFYVYNGTKIDGNLPSPTYYGAFPPAQATVFLKGPLMDADGLDNPSGIDEGFNGYNFGDGIADNEHYGLRHFIFPLDGGAGPPAPPMDAEGYYRILQSIFPDGKKMEYGGWGYPAPYSGTCGPEADFMWPGDSDPLNWGTNYQIPNCLEGEWTEEATDLLPGSRTGLGSAGPFTFPAGGMQTIDLALVFGRDFTDSSQYAAIDLMRERIDLVREYFLNDSTPCGGSFNLGISPSVKNPEGSIKIFPNPAKNKIYVHSTGLQNQPDYTYRIFDLTGKPILEGRDQTPLEINIVMLPQGFYIIRVQTTDGTFSGRFIKYD